MRASFQGTGTPGGVVTWTGVYSSVVVPTPNNPSALFPAFIENESRGQPPHEMEPQHTACQALGALHCVAVSPQAQACVGVGTHLLPMHVCSAVHCVVQVPQ